MCPTVCVCVAESSLVQQYKHLTTVINTWTTVCKRAHFIAISTQSNQNHIIHTL